MIAERERPGGGMGNPARTRAESRAELSQERWKIPGMRIAFGNDEESAREGVADPVFWHEADAVNGHIGLFGMSGSGKTFTLRRIVSQVASANAGARVHIMDVHGDLQMPNESVVRFSEATPWGINPLRLSSHPDFGGVRKRIQSFLSQLDEVGRSPMGERQASSLRNLLIDLYSQRGFRMDDPSTWREERGAPPAGAAEGRIYLDIPFDAKDAAKEAARNAGIRMGFDGDVKCWWVDRHEGALERYPLRAWGKTYPTLADAAAFAKTRLRSLTTGGGTKSTRLLEEHNKKVVAWQAKARKMEAGQARNEDVAELRAEVTEGIPAIVESFSEYVENIASGRELDALIRYDTLDTMRSLVNRLDGMVNAGIFNSGVPPFDENAPVWRHDLTALSLAEQRLYVFTVVTRLFEEARERGIAKGAADILDLIVVDEASKFFKDTDSNIIDIVAREGRKYGVGLVAASQSPAEFSDSFLSNTSVKVLLKLDDTEGLKAKRKMLIPDEILNGIEMGRVAAIQIVRRGQASSPYRLTRVAK